MLIGRPASVEGVAVKKCGVSGATAAGPRRTRNPSVTRVRQSSRSRRSDCPPASRGSPSSSPVRASMACTPQRLARGVESRRVPRESWESRARCRRTRSIADTQRPRVQPGRRAHHLEAAACDVRPVRRSRCWRPRAAAAPAAPSADASDPVQIGSRVRPGEDRRRAGRPDSSRCPGRAAAHRRGEAGEKRLAKRPARRQSNSAAGDCDRARARRAARRNAATTPARSDAVRAELARRRSGRPRSRAAVRR